MMRRKTLTAALRHARACIMQAETSNLAGKQQDTHDWLGNALRNTTEARVMPVDMAQLRKLATAYMRRPGQVIGARVDSEATTLNNFLTYIKDHAK